MVSDIVKYFRISQILKFDQKIIILKENYQEKHINIYNGMSIIWPQYVLL